MQLIACSCGEVYAWNSPEHWAHVSKTKLLPPNIQELGRDYALRVRYRNGRAAAYLRHVHAEYERRAAQDGARQAGAGEATANVGATSQAEDIEETFRAIAQELMRLSNR